jgi:mannitol/fructose-specific phosphotransferase system IIA component
MPFQSHPTNEAKMTAVSYVIHADHILLDQDLADKQKVLKVIGEVLLTSGDVTPRYVEGMFQKEEQYSTWVTEGVALPHGTNEVKCEVVRNTLVVVQIPKGVDWGKGKIVRLAIGFAGRGDEEHMRMLASLAGILQHRDLVNRLASTKDKSEAVEILTRNDNSVLEAK